MSKVSSFRIDEDNPREARAIDVIHTWVSQGYSLRYILTDALIQNGNIQENSNILAESIDRLSELVREFDNGGGSKDRRDELTNPMCKFLVP